MHGGTQFAQRWRVRVQRMRSSTIPCPQMLTLSLTVPRRRIMRSLTRGLGVAAVMLYTVPSAALIIRQFAVTPAKGQAVADIAVAALGRAQRQAMT